MKQDDLKLRYRYYLFLGASLVLSVFSFASRSRRRLKREEQGGPESVSDSASHAFSPSPTLSDIFISRFGAL